MSDTTNLWAFTTDTSSPYTQRIISFNYITYAVRYTATYDPTTYNNPWIATTVANSNLYFVYNPGNASTNVVVAYTAVSTLTPTTGIAVTMDSPGTATLVTSTTYTLTLPDPTFAAITWTPFTVTSACAATLGTFTIIPNCTTTPAVCGDGIVETGETCDDGNTVSGDGCSSTC